MSRKKLHRRMFLRAAGGVSLGLPLLNMFESSAHAQTAVSDDGFPLRFVFFYHPNGVTPMDWWPPGTPTERQWRFGTATEPLGRHRDHLMFLDGLDMAARPASPGGPHQQMGALLTGRPLLQGNQRGGNVERFGTAGWGSGISIDQAIARHIGGSSPFGSLHFGVRTGTSGVWSRLSYAGADQPISPENNPAQMYNRLFANLQTGGGGREMARLQARKVSMLDLVRDQFSALERRAGAEDRMRLEQHAAQISDLQARIQNMPVEGASCERPQAPGNINPDSANTMDRVSRLQLDMMVMAMACGLTQVATIQYANGPNSMTFPWLNSNRNDHQLGHEAFRNMDSRREWTLRHRWYAGEFAYMLDRMREIPEGAGTMLDHTVVIWSSEIGAGYSHEYRRLPFVLAGNLGGRFRTGRYLNFRGRSQNDLWVSIQNAFGIDANVFGDPRFCNGALPGLTA